MRAILLTALTLLPSTLFAQAAASLPTAEQQIASAVLALPEGMRAGAAVLGYHMPAHLVELRKGSNGMTCLADDPANAAFHVACYHESLEPFMARGRALRAEGVKGGMVDSTRFKEIKAGTLKMPTTPAALYSLSGAAGSWDPATNAVKEGAGALRRVHRGRHVGLHRAPGATGRGAPLDHVPGNPEGAHHVRA